MKEEIFEMAFWNRNNKKEVNSIAGNSSSSRSQVEINNSLFRDLTQDVALYMHSVKITQQPILKFFHDDQGICKGLFVQHTTNPQLLQIKKMSDDTYLRVVGMHAFGAGVYVTALQGKLDKPIGQFSSNDLYTISRDFEQTDSYELALKVLQIPVDSKNKKVLDGIMETALETFKNCVGSAIMEPLNLGTYMQVLFNAGITMVLRA